MLNFTAFSISLIMKIAYLTTCFGTQSHTFIRREIRALRGLGLDLTLYGIRKDSNNLASDAADLVAQTCYLYPLSWAYTLKCNAKSLRRSPVHYLRGLFSAFGSPEFGIKRRAKMVYHYVIAAGVGEQALADRVTHIHAHFMNVSASIAMYAAHHAQLPFSVTAHSAGEFRTPHTLGVHQKLKQAQFLLMISNYNIEYFDAIEPCRQKSHIVRCGMDLQDFTYRLASAYQVHSPARLLAVGRFVEKKGFHYLIEAAHILKNRGISFNLALIGDGQFASQLKSLAEQLDLNQLVTFLGQKGTDFVRQEMGEADLVIVPSVTSASGEMEGLPVVIMEAMASGVPVIASAHSGIPEIVRSGETGQLTAEKDPQSIASAITDFLQNPCPQQIANARRLIEDTFNIDVVAEQRLDLFKRYHSDP